METFKKILLTVAVCVQVRSQESTGDPPIQIPKPNISQNPTHNVLYSTETVTLHCEVPKGASELQYVWYKDTTDLKTDQPSINVADGGIYECKAKNGSSESEKSAKYNVTIQDLPKVQVQSDWTEAFPGEKVSLRCVKPDPNPESENWTYMWFKGSGKIDSSDETSIKDNTLTLSVTSSHAGLYTCQAELKDRMVKTAQSKTHSLTVHELPRPNLAIDSQWKTFYPNEKVTLKCSIDGDSNDWGYEWFKDGARLSDNKDFSLSGNTLSISSAKASDSGQYTCRGKHLKRTPVTTGHTEALQLQIYDKAPKPDIRKDQWFEPFYTEEKIQLDCNMPGDGWMYDWYKDSKQTEPQITNRTFTINSASPSDTGVYHCTAKRGDFSVNSDTLQVRVQEPPQPNLAIDSQWKTFYPNEKVTLKCSIDGDSNDWGYEWFKDGAQLYGNKDISFPGNTLTINSANASYSGQYTCRGKHLKRTPVTTRHTEALKLQIYDKTPKPDIRKDQWFEPFYTEEKIQLGCNMTGDGWKYDWYKDSKQTEPRITDPTFTINSASLSDAGVYHCTAKRGDFSVNSDTLQVRVQEPSQPKLSIESDWKTFYPNEKVTLKCSIDGDSNDWGYEWFKDGAQPSGNKDISFPGNILSISSAKASYSGQYTCRGKHLKRTPVTTGHTEALKLQIYDKTPKPDIRKDQWFEPFYTGEKIQLGCNMTGDGWKYDWYKGSTQTEPRITDPTFTINSASPSNTGDYQCKAKRGDFFVESETLQVRVKDLPKVQVQSEWKEAFPGENVSLQCLNPDPNPESKHWTYMWFKGSEKIVSKDETSIKDNTLTLSVTSSHAGLYTCQAELKDRMVKTAQSNSYALTVHGSKPTVVLKQDPSYPEIYTGEQVKLTCSIEQKTSNWGFKWQKDSVQVNNSHIYTISNATLDHNGEYTCTISRREMTFANSTKLKITEPPRPNLSIHSQWKTFYPNEKVTLKCSIDGDPNDWGYDWYRSGAQLHGDKDISFSGNTLTISSAKASHSGQYTCRGKHLKRKPVTTGQTEALQLQIHGNTPKPDIRKYQWFDFFYTGEEVQLGCNMPGDGWKYDWYKGSKHLISNRNHSINLASLSHAGVYHCTAKRGDFSVDSETLQVQVKARPPADLSLETDLSDIISGNILTLRCNVSDGRQWSYAWYENGQRLNGSSDIFKVTATEETIKSEFKCKGIRTERPLYSALSEGFTANNIILKRKILLAISGCLVCCILLMIIGCLVLKMTRKPEKKETLQEDLFFSMADSKKQTASPLEEYMDNSPTEMEEKEELLTDHVSDVHVDGVIKAEDSPVAEANGLTSFTGL